MTFNKNCGKLHLQMSTDFNPSQPARSDASWRIGQCFQVCRRYNACFKISPVETSFVYFWFLCCFSTVGKQLFWFSLSGSTFIHQKKWRTVKCAIINTRLVLDEKNRSCPSGFYFGSAYYWRNFAVLKIFEIHVWKEYQTTVRLKKFSCV